MNEQNASFQLNKFQKNILFFLQLLILLFIIIILVQPILSSDKITASEVVFVMDLSASMDREDHFSKIKDDALEVLENIQSAQITIVEANETPTIAFYKETDQQLIRNYLENLALNYGKDKMIATYPLVQSLIENKNIPIYIFSDDVTKEEVRKNFPTNQVTVFNSSKENKVSITNFLVANASSFITLNNSSDEAVTGKVLFYENNKLAQEVEVTLASEERKSMTLEQVNSADYYKVELVIEDSFVLDNEMYYVPTALLKGVFIQQTVNPYVQKAIQTIDPTSQIIEDLTLANEGFVVTNEFLPNATSPFIYFHQGKKKVSLSSSELTIQSDPLIEYADFNDVLIVGAYEDLDSTRLEVIVQNNEIPLIAKGKTENQTPYIVINFDVADSDWPLHISFPLFFYSAINYLQEEPNFTNVAPNEPLVVTTTNKVTIFDEASKAVKTYQPLEETVFSPSKPGIYQLKSGENIQFFSVNIDESQKKGKAEENFVWNEEMVYTGESETKNTGAYLRWLMVLVFLLLLTEWGIVNRDNRI